MAFEMETTHRIYSDDGYMYELRPDPDGLGLVEIRYFDDVDDKEPKQTIMICEDAIGVMIQALQQQLNQIVAAKNRPAIPR